MAVLMQTEVKAVADEMLGSSDSEGMLRNYRSLTVSAGDNVMSCTHGRSLTDIGHNVFEPRFRRKQFGKPVGGG